MVFLGSIFVSLSTPIVILIYGRGSFNQNAIDVVSQLLIAYGIGMPFYLSRDLLVRVFYGIEDAKLQCELNALQVNEIKSACSSELSNYGSSYNKYLEVSPSIKA